MASRMMTSPPAFACSPHRWAPAYPVPDNVCDAPISRMGARATCATTASGQTDGRSHELDASEEPIFCTSLSHVETMVAGLKVRLWPIAGCQRCSHARAWQRPCRSAPVGPGSMRATRSRGFEAIGEATMVVELASRGVAQRPEGAQHRKYGPGMD